MKTINSYISRHLLPVITIFFVAGIWVVPTLSPILFLTISPAVLGFSVIGFFILLHFFSKKSYRPFLLAICALVIGYVHGLNHMQPPVSGQHIYNLVETKSEVVLTGYLAEMVVNDGKISRAVIDTDTLRKKEDIVHTPTHGKIRLSFRGEWPTSILPGDHIVVRAIIKRPRSYYSAGAFDYERFLAQKDIWITGFIRSPLFIKQLTNDNYARSKIFYLPERLRTHLGHYLDASLPQEFSSIYRALLLGDKSGISREHLELFKATGTFHILAISGLHVAVIATFLYLILYWLFSRSERLLLFLNVRKLVAAITLPLLLGYALLAGMNSPVTRAFLMSSIVIFALCTDRVKSPAPLVAAAALVILIFDPLQLYTVSFQLSFAATIGILFIFPYLQQILHLQLHEKQPSSLQKARLYLISAFLVSVVATLATAPIAASSFNRISTIGPLANLIMEPLICLWCLPFGIVALPFMYISPPLADFILSIGSYGILIALKIARLLASLPYASIHVTTPTPPFMLIYACIFSGCATGLFLKNIKSVLVLFVSSILIISVLLFGWWPSSNTHPTVSYLDVGQGSATIIQDGSNTVVIDGGGSSFSSRSVGKSVIAPYLWNKGITRVDAIIVTHPDADHYNGLPYIAEMFNPKTIWVRDTKGHDDAYKEFLGQAKLVGAKVNIAKAGDILYEGNLRLECTANLGGKTFPVTRGSRSNNSGLIIKGCVGESCILFPGDIGIAMENYLLAQHTDLEADVYLAAHHGSTTSNSLGFLQQIQPDYAIVSAGSSNKGYFPHHSFLEKCKNLGIHVLNTSVNGTIEVTLGRNAPQIETTRKYRNNPLYPLRAEDLMYTPSEIPIKKPE